MTWWARWRKRTCRRCACVYFASWETGTSRKLCIDVKEKLGWGGEGEGQHRSSNFTDTVAILNLLDLRSIMGCQRGTRSAFTRAFWPKRELHCIFLGEKGDHYYTSNTARTTIFLSPIRLQSFSRKTWRKIGPRFAVPIRKSVDVLCSM